MSMPIGRIAGVSGALIALSLHASEAPEPQATGQLPSVLPVAVDNSTTIWFPPVRSQGSLGSCVFFSQTYYTMSYLVNQSLNRDGRDPADNTTKMSPLFTFNISNAGGNSGGSDTTGFKVMAKYGAPTWAEFPYTSNYKILPTTAAIWRSALRHRIGQIGQVSGMNTAQGREMAKRILAGGNLLNYSTYIDAWKGESMKTLRDNPASALDDGIVGNRVVIFTHEIGGGPHAMTIVGYNDHAWSDINANGSVDEGELGAFKVVN
ncbi:MAG: Endoglucanase precursor, partial [Planctomycetota bacterium]